MQTQTHLEAGEVILADALVDALRAARSVCVLTGAGISAESGVPTFRGAEGLWKKFKPEELANFDAFISNPALVWEWYEYRRRLIHSVQPNPGHHALVELERLIEDFTLVTQNVDNLHRRAGSRRILELHGNIERSYCIACGTPENGNQLDPGEIVPRCRACGGLMRPDVFWFGETLPEEIFQQAEAAADRADLFLCIGTSSIVYPAASLPLSAKRAGAFVVELNTEATDLSPRADVVLRSKSGALLPAFVQTLKTSRGTP